MDTKRTISHLPMNSDTVLQTTHMEKYGRPIHLRLTADALRQFSELQSRYKGLGASLLLRMLVNDQLSKSVDELDAIVNRQIRGKQDSSKPKRN